MDSGLPGWIAPAVVGGVFLVFLASETLRPLRRSREPKLRRIGRNLTMAGLAFATIELLQIPILLPISAWVIRERIGLLHWLGLSGLAPTLAGIVLPDYPPRFPHLPNPP